MLNMKKQEEKEKKVANEGVRRFKHTWYRFMLGMHYTAWMDGGKSLQKIVVIDSR